MPLEDGRLPGLARVLLEGCHQRLVQLGAGLEALLGVLLQQAQDDAVERGRHAGIHRGGRWWLL
jgi:hypothetical protein